MLPDVTTTWNGPLGGGASAGVAWANVGSDGFARRFADALNERVAAALWHRGPWPEPGGRPKRGVSPTAFLVAGEGDTYEYGPLYSATVPAPGFDPTRFHPEPNAPLAVGPTAGAAGYWNRLQRKLGGQVRSDLFTGSTGLLSYFAEAGGDWHGREAGATAIGFVDGSLSLPAEALRRKFPREIWSLSNPGQAGWVARFAVHLGTADAQSPAPDGSPRPPVTTPEAERGYGGRIYVHDGGAWQPAADQSLRPNVVTLYGFAEEGDTFGPWVAEDLRTQLHRMRVTFVSEEPHFSGTGVGEPHYFYSRITITVEGDAYSDAAPDGPTEDVWNSGVNLRVQGADPYRFYSSFAMPGASISTLLFGGFAVRTRYRCFSDRMPLPPMGAGCRARGYVWARQIVELIPGGVLEMPFVTHGDPVEQDTWTPLGPEAMALGTYTSEQVGSLDLPAGDFAGYRGMIGLWMRWDVEGGFRYQSERAGETPEAGAGAR